MIKEHNRNDIDVSRQIGFVIVDLRERRIIMGSIESPGPFTTETLCPGHVDHVDMAFSAYSIDEQGRVIVSE